jgi:PAS domain S-box-containing protein
MFRHGRNCMGYWSASWSAQAVVAALMLLQSSSGPIAVRQIALHGLMIAGVWLLARGIHLFTSHKSSPIWLIGSIGALVLEAATGTSGWATYAWIILMQATAGIFIWRDRSMQGRGPKFLSVGLILWALIPLSSPFYKWEAWLFDWAGIANAFLSLASAMGLLILFYEEKQSDLQHSQEQLEKNGATLRAILYTAPVSIALVKDRHIVWANPAAEKIVGYSLEELTNFPTRRLHVSQEDWQRTGEELYSQMERQGWGSVEAGYMHKDGHELICLIQGGPLNREDPSEGHIINVMDITARKRAEQQLTRQQERLEEIVEQRTSQLEKANLELRHENLERKQAQDELFRQKELFYSLAEQAPLGISLLGPDGHYRYLNPKFVKTFGYELSDIPRGRDWFEKVYPDAGLRREALTAWQDDLKTHGVGEARPRTYPVQCRDGSRKTIEFRPVAMASGDNLVFYVDVTEQKKIEAQLAHAEKMDAIGTLSGGVAHEFNNILMAMRGYLQLLSLEDDLSNKAKERVTKVVQATDRAADLIKKMLTFSHLDSDDLTLVDANTAVQTVYGILQQSLDQKIEIDLELTPDPPDIRANYAQLEQILLNLALNASDAISGPGRITISTSSQELDDSFTSIHPWANPGRYMVISVADTGQGMTPDIACKAFDPFFTTKGPDKGTGLGLAVAYALVHNLGGGIQIETESGKGSTFIIYLPLPKQETLETTT